MARPTVTPARHVPDAERRARLGVRHLVAAPRGRASPEAIADALVGLHATEPASVFLSAWARTPDLTVADVDRAFHTDRTLVRQMCLRQTVFGMPRDLLPALVGSVGRRFADRFDGQVARTIERAGVTDDGAAWLARAGDAVVAELAASEPLTTRQVRERVPEAAASYAQGAGTAWAGTVQLTPRVLWLLQLAGRVVRCGNDADWRTSAPLWTTTERWLGPFEPTEERAAYAELVARYLASYGPATVSDAAWWLGSTKGAVTAALGDVGAVPVSLDGSAEPGWLLPDDVDPVAAPDAWVALLPLLDPSIMGWKDRAFALGDHAPLLFDSVGNAGTSAWVDGRVVGAWVQDEAQRVRLRLLEPVSTASGRALDEAAERLTDWLDGQRVFPVYPSAAMKGG